MKKNKKIEHEVTCLKCNHGKIKTILTDLGDQVSFEVHKCSNKNCGYQFGIKEYKDNYFETK